MIQDDRSYYQRRAEIETERAQQAVLPEVVQVHYALAEAYLEKVAAAGRVQAGA
jgi:hypothetical protein